MKEKTEILTTILTTVFEDNIDKELLKSVRNNDIDNVILLLDNGADVTIKDEHGDTPLHVAYYYNRMDMVKLLLDNGADVNVKNNYQKKPEYYYKKYKF